MLIRMANRAGSGDKETQDPLLSRATELVQTAQIHAVGIFSALTDRFPILRQVDLEQWDFVLTVAGVFMAATRLNNLRLDGAREDALMEIVADSLSRWKSEAIRGFEDCKELFESEFDRLTAARHESRFVVSDSVGNWIVWNVLGHPPQTDEECLLVRTIGITVTHNFFDWWNE